MMTLRKRRRVQVLLLASLSLAGAAALAAYGLGEGVQFYRTPSQALAAPPGPDEVFRVGGVVAPGSVVRGQGTAVAFAVTDGAATVPVTFDGILPDLFEEGSCTIATGRLRDGALVATDVLAKHDEAYAPREVVASLGVEGDANPCDATRAPSPES